MELVRLTNLGNTTLRNILGINERLGPKASSKKQKLAKLWSSQEAMNSFKQIFQFYHTPVPNPVIRKGSEYSTIKGLYGTETKMDSTTAQLMEEFSQYGLIKFNHTNQSPDDFIETIETDNRNNPAKYLEKTTIELTGLCNLLCKHCFRGGSKKDEPGLPVETLKQSLKPILRAGVRGITITGGEPTLKRDTLVELVDFLSQYLELKDYGFKTSKPDRIGILSNGFFGQKEELVETFASYGAIMQVSLDSYDESITDTNRGVKGVFASIKQLVEISKKKNMKIKLTSHNLGNISSTAAKENYSYFNQRAEVQEFYGMHQVGNAAENEFGIIEKNHSFEFNELSYTKPHTRGWCKGFTRPTTLTIRPTGKIGNCAMGYAIPDEFGNVTQTPMIDIINNIQKSRINRMFFDESIEKYQREIDSSLFRKKFSGSCEPIIITATYGLIKEELMRSGMNEKNAIRNANCKVAGMYGFSARTQ